MFQKFFIFSRKPIFFFSCFLSLLMVIPIGRHMARADDRRDAQELAEKSRWLLEDIEEDSHFEEFRNLLPRAKGIFLVPHLWKGAFVVGALGGNGLLMVRDDRSGEWNGPGFYTLGGASYGPQVGGEIAQTVFLIMTEKGVTSFLANHFKLGADVSVSIGPLGKGASAATANLSADILSFSRSRGLYVGATLSGAVIAVRNDWNRAYFGKRITPKDIFIRGAKGPEEIKKLIEEIEKLQKSGKNELRTCTSFPVG